MNTIIGLTEDNFEKEVLRADGPVLVDFYAPECGACRMLAPLLEQLAGEFDGKIKFAKLNVDDTPEQASCYGITGAPTLMLFRGGKPVDQLVGFAPPRSLKNWLENAAAEKAAA
jgi:thioredoxin 1